MNINRDRSDFEIMIQLKLPLNCILGYYFPITKALIEYSFYSRALYTRNFVKDLDIDELFCNAKLYFLSVSAKPFSIFSVA